MSSILHWHDERTDTEVCYYSDHVAAVRDERECHANEGAGPFPMRGPEHSESCRWRGLRCSCGYGKEA